MGSAPLEIDIVEAVDGAYRVRVAGELDSSSADRLLTVLLGLDRPDAVVIEASALRFIDSSGVNVLVRADDALGLSSGIRIEGATDVVRTILEITALDGRFLDDG